MSLTLGYVQKTNWRRGARWKETAGGVSRAASLAWFVFYPAALGDASDAT
jgi:hypothetical protein